MSKKTEATEKCDALGFHPLSNPMGDSHHTDAPFSIEDRNAGDALSYFLGGLFVDLEGGEKVGGDLSSLEEWTRVARALRIHGLQITDRRI